MANIDMPVLNASVTCSSDETKSSLALAPKDSTNTGIDLTGAAFTMKYAPAGQGVDSIFAAAGSVSLLSAGAGAAVLSIGTGDGHTPAGNYNAAIFVTPASGTAQLLARLNMAVI